MSKVRKPDTHINPLLPASIPPGPASADDPLQHGHAKPTPAFFTTRQLAARWALSERQVHRYLDNAELIATRFGRSVRISAEEVARFEAARFGVK